MGFELQQYLKDLNADGSLNDEELKQMQAALGKDKVLARLREKHEDGLRQSEFSKKMNDLTEKETATLALQQELIAWRNEADGKLKAANLTVRQEREARAAIEAKLKHAAETYNLDPEALGLTSGEGKGGTDGKGDQPQTPTYVKQEDWEKEMGEMRARFPILPAIIHDLSAEHQTLFGKPLGNVTELVQKAMEQKKALRQVWEEDNKVPERRTQLQEEGIQARITQAVTQREAQLRSELQLPPTPRAVDHSPVLAEFKTPSDKGATKELSAVDRAVTAYEEHRYAPDQKTA